MTWFTIGAFLVLALLLTNSIFVIARRKRSPASATLQPALKRKMSASAVFAMLVVVAAWVAGIGAPVFWPESAFGQFMSSKLNLTAYFIWCGFTYVVFNVAWHLLTSRRPVKNDGAV